MTYPCPSIDSLYHRLALYAASPVATRITRIFHPDAGIHAHIPLVKAIGYPRYISMPEDDCQRSAEGVVLHPSKIQVGSGSHSDQHQAARARLLTSRYSVSLTHARLAPCHRARSVTVCDSCSSHAVCRLSISAMQVAALPYVHSECASTCGASLGPNQG